jgi:hypothetical protein
MADDGAIVIVVAHRPALVGIADSVVRIGGDRPLIDSQPLRQGDGAVCPVTGPLSLATGEW